MTKRRTSHDDIIQEWVPDHPDQAFDTTLPSDDVNEDIFLEMVQEYEGDPEEVDGQAGDDDG